MQFLLKRTVDWFYTLSAIERKMAYILLATFASGFVLMIITIFNRFDVPFPDPLAVLQLILFTLFSLLTFIALFMYRAWWLKFLLMVIFLLSLAIWAVSFVIFLHPRAPNAGMERHTTNLIPPGDLSTSITEESTGFWRKRINLL
jgi:ABC-type transport system involved in multi-copper enzyme maturation permease subunit